MRIQYHKLDAHNDYDAPTKESMRINHIKYHEDDHLYYRSPIEVEPEAVLPAKIGQDWNQVYSDLCHRYDRRTYAGTEIRKQLKNYVEEKAYLSNDGSLRNSKGEIINHKSFPEFYVNPNNNKLEKAD